MGDNFPARAVVHALKNKEAGLGGFLTDLLRQHDRTSPRSREFDG